MNNQHKRKRFNSKLQGYQAAVKVWTCKSCGNPHERRKPNQCAICNFNDFHYFASKAEMRRNGELEMFLTLGTIKNLQRQVTYRLIVNSVLITKYVADFVYQDHDGNVIVEDVKGHKDAISKEFEIKKALMAAINQVNVKTVIYSN